MTIQHDGIFGSVTTSIITAFVALLPDCSVDYAANYGGKLLSVFILAMAAELGRRLINKMWKPK